MDVLEAIHQGDQAAIQRLAANPGALNRADAQGNTPLHYAVAQRDLELIERLIKQGAPIAAENLQGETATDWFQEFIVSIYNLEQPIDLKELREAIAENDVQFVADYLKGGVSRILRFSRGETLLHIAVAAQQKAIIALLLEGMNHEAIEWLLHLTNSRGLTPRALAQQHCQPNSRVAQEIVNLLQEKQRAAATEVAASALQIPLPLTLMTIEQQEIKALAGSFRHPLTSADFEQLNPLRSTLVKLACNTALRACEHLSQLHLPTLPFRKQQSVVEKLLQLLFGVWNDKTLRNLEQKLCSVADYLNHLIQQQQVEQIIQFSDEISHYEGWNDSEKNKIFLNPTRITGVVSLVTTLLHEVTHQVDRSYDFFLPDYSIKKQGFSINLESAYRLAANGEAKKLTSEQRRLFEIRQRLELGNVSEACLQQNLSRWMALNSAETLAIAILALATVPAGSAEVLMKSWKPILQIHRQFLSVEAVAAPFGSPRRSPAQILQHSPEKHPRPPAGPLESLKKSLRPGSSGSHSTCSGSSGERSSKNQQAFVESLKQKIVSERPSKEAVGQPGASTTSTTSPWLLIPSSARPPQ